MFPWNFVLPLTALSAALCSGKNIQILHELEDPHPSLHDDIRLSPEQKQEMKERGFYTAMKWPKENGVVTVPYYFDTTYFSESDPFRNKFKFATQIYKNQTCIDWVEVPKTDSRHKVKVTQDGGCWSFVGRMSGAEQTLSLSYGCHSTGTMIHEMGHCVGLQHTQSRSDRDKYVKPWLRFVKSGLEDNFAKAEGETFQIPYDYKSMMHYGNDFFSVNGSLTLTTLDPLAIFAIGSRPETFRYSDAALLNKGYSCITEFTTKCGEKNCLNGGFVGKDCKCRCPENTKGVRCETITGAFFSDVPVCGGVINNPGDIKSLGYPSTSTQDKCIFAIKAPPCKVPAITFTEAKFQYTTCYSNKLSLEVSPVSYGFTWCDANKIPLGKTIVAETQNANVYYYTMARNTANLGFKASVQFLNSTKCP